MLAGAIIAGAISGLITVVSGAVEIGKDGVIFTFTVLNALFTHLFNLLKMVVDFQRGNPMAFLVLFGGLFLVLGTVTVFNPDFSFNSVYGSASREFYEVSIPNQLDSLYYVNVTHYAELDSALNEYAIEESTGNLFTDLIRIPTRIFMTWASNPDSLTASPSALAERIESVVPDLVGDHTVGWLIGDSMIKVVGNFEIPVPRKTYGMTITASIEKAVDNLTSPGINEFKEALTNGTVCEHDIELIENGTSSGCYAIYNRESQMVYSADALVRSVDLSSFEAEHFAYEYESTGLLGPIQVLGMMISDLMYFINPVVGQAFGVIELIVLMIALLVLAAMGVTLIFTLNSLKK